MESFSDFITSLPETFDVRGDFIDDTKFLIGLKKFPSITMWTELEFFLLSRNACHEAIVAARGVWREYNSPRFAEGI